MGIIGNGEGAAGLSVTCGKGTGEQKREKRFHRCKKCFS